MTEAIEARDIVPTAYFWLHLWRMRKPLFTLLAGVRGLKVQLRSVSDKRIAFRFPQFQEWSHPGFDRQVDESYAVVVIDCTPEFRPLFFREVVTKLGIDEEGHLADIYEAGLRRLEKEACNGH